MSLTMPEELATGEHFDMYHYCRVHPTDDGCRAHPDDCIAWCGERFDEDDPIAPPEGESVHIECIVCEHMRPKL